MSTHKHFDTICCVVLIFTLLLVIFFANAESFGIKKVSSSPGYEIRLFEPSRVHTIDIVMDNWDEFLENCKSEEYYACSVVIDSEAYKNVAIRAKGNTSLTQVEAYGNNRYSLKIEFDHYDTSKTYYGLDKLCLNNIIQDNTYMKDYLTYQMMAQIGVASPLCSYVNITVNGEAWGLYLAVEGVEESFLQRNYGKDYGELYKPDSSGMGGGRGNGEEFDMDKFGSSSESENNDSEKMNQKALQEPDDIPKNDPNGNGQMPDEIPGGQRPDGNVPGGIQGGTPPEFPDGAVSFYPGTMPGGGMGSDDVLLKYIDDDPDNYPNIFDNAKTDITNQDKTRLIEALKKLSEGEDLADTVDVEAVIRYFVVHNFVLNFDSYTGSMIHNYYLYEQDGQMQMIPWDYNLAFGGFESASGASDLVNYPIDSPVSGGNIEDRPMIAWIFESEEYTELYHRYFSEFLSAWFKSGSFENLIDDVFSMISPYVEKDPTKFCTYEEFEKGVSTFKEFCFLRSESIEGQLCGNIGSTSAAQKSSELIDAGDLQISDMGSMQNFMGGGMRIPNSGEPKLQEPADHERFGQRPVSDEDSGSLSSSEQTPSNDSDGRKTKPASGMAPQMAQGQMPAGNPTDGQNEDVRGRIPADMAGEFPNGNGVSDQIGQKNTFERSSDLIPNIMWIAVSAGILAAGIAFAFWFKRRR